MKVSFRTTNTIGNILKKTPHSIDMFGLLKIIHWAGRQDVPYE
jgi:hypothetical protein